MRDGGGGKVGKAHTVGGGAHHEDRPAAGAETPTGGGGKARARERGGKESGARGKEDVAAARTKRNCGAAAAVGSKDVAWLPAYCPNPKSPYYSPYYQPMSQEISPQISQPWNLVVYVQVGRLIAISLRLMGRPEF